MVKSPFGTRLTPASSDEGKSTTAMTDTTVAKEGQNGVIAEPSGLTDGMATANRISSKPEKDVQSTIKRLRNVCTSQFPKGASAAEQTLSKDVVEVRNEIAILKRKFEDDDLDDFFLEGKFNDSSFRINYDKRLKALEDIVFSNNTEQTDKLSKTIKHIEDKQQLMYERILRIESCTKEFHNALEHYGLQVGNVKIHEKLDAAADNMKEGEESQKALKVEVEALKREMAKKDAVLQDVGEIFEVSD